MRIRQCLQAFRAVRLDIQAIENGVRARSDSLASFTSFTSVTGACQKSASWIHHTPTPTSLDPTKRATRRSDKRATGAHMVRGREWRTSLPPSRPKQVARASVSCPAAHIFPARAAIDMHPEGGRHAGECKRGRERPTNGSAGRSTGEPLQWWGEVGVGVHRVLGPPSTLSYAELMLWALQTSAVGACGRALACLLAYESAGLRGLKGWSWVLRERSGSGLDGQPRLSGWTWGSMRQQ